MSQDPFVRKVEKFTCDKRAKSTQSREVKMNKKSREGFIKTWREKGSGWRRGRRVRRREFLERRGGI